MEASFGPVLANIIMTECERVTVDNLVKDETIKFYIRYLCTYCDANIIPNFTNLRKLKQINKTSHFKFCRKLLYDEISNKHKNLKGLKKQQQESQNLLKDVATWMKQKCITYSINCIISKYIAEVKS